MSYRQLISSAIDTAFNALGDLVTTCTYRTKGEYSPSTGTVGAGTDYSCPAVITEYDFRDVDNTLIMATDRKAIVRAASLAVQPTTEGVFLIGSKQFAIITVRTDPAGATYELQLRA
jgi:hypothetical protein